MSVYVCSDLHGMKQLYDSIKDVLKDGGTLIVNGDIIDRGGSGWPMLVDALSDSRIKFNKGNHEDMLFNFMAKVRKNPKAPYTQSKEYRLCAINGGEKTISDYLAAPKEEQDFVYNRLKEDKCCTTVKYDDVAYIIIHSGSMKDPYWDRSHFLVDDVPKNTVLIHGHTPILYLNQEYDLMKGPYIYGNNQKINLDAGTAYTGIAYLLNLDDLSYEIFQL